MSKTYIAVKKNKTTSYEYEKAFNTSAHYIKVKLLLISFIDENGIYIVYSPHLDLSGYGKNEKEAQESFDINLEEFIDYTIKKKTLSNVLKKLGWQVKKEYHKLPQKVLSPSIQDLLNRDYVAEIMDKYSTTTTHKEIEIPDVIL